ncbi:aldo/keto reductase [Pseudonocardia sp. DSM 110487]|uniref:aldo/keto reductase n=1 Tax=Pseudonocardia sp. DSM 110487 TaxID=2865833 RepID=UPI0021072500|nr:aldo/keto reductase [Pseudonocardia sp. DSM 110487]
MLDAALTCGVRAIDTAFNYDGFGSHRRLRRLELIDEFSVSTKVGFFPSPSGGVEHSLDPARLQRAIETSATDLGRRPDIVFLHSPERSLPQQRSPQGGREESPAEAREMLWAACAVLEQARADGWCERWGMACWDPFPVWRCLSGAEGEPRLDVVMTRAGLMAKPQVLDAAEALAQRYDLPAQARWGMSPFGGDAQHAVWDAIDPRRFVRSPHGDTGGEPRPPRPSGAGSGVVSRLAAAFRAAFELPSVGRVAVGASSAAHLDELVTAAGLDLDAEEIGRYRALLRTLTPPAASG